jgi:lipoprotein-anchoring transpeptidase ErfK/SrfK
MKIIIDIPTQTLELFDDSGKSLHRYQVSTGANGLGEENGSFCTPRGKHVIRAKIGAGLPVNTVFVKRRSTGEIYSQELGALYPERDWILTRILWLSGKEPGFNRFGSCDTMSRYIYIHGTPDSTELGKPGSRGCVRMRNAELVELFDAVKVGTQIEIIA